MEDKKLLDKIEKKVIQILKKEGGAAGLDPLKKAVDKMDQPKGFNLKSALKKMKNVEKHKESDYILTPINEAKYGGMPIRDNVMDYANEILNQIKDYENNVGPGEQMIDYNATREAARALMNAVDRDEEGMMEANTTGTGASFTAGTGAGYMTPRAFKKKRKDD